MQDVQMVDCGEKSLSALINPKNEEITTPRL